MNRRVLIAGCGDLGQRVAGLLLSRQNLACWGLRRTPGSRGDGADARLQWITADVNDPQTLLALPEGLTDLVYCAAPGERTQEAYEAVFFRGLQHVVQAMNMSALERIVFVSSTAVYGDHGQAWINEDTPTDPKAFNGRILVQTEAWLRAFGALHPSLKTTSLRLSGIYGSGRTYLLERLRQGLASAPEHGTHWVNRIHIEDAAASVLHVLNLPDPSPLYLVTDSTPLPMRTLYEALALLVNGPTPPLGKPPESVGSKRLSNQRLLDSGFEFRWPDSRQGHAALLQLPAQGKTTGYAG